MKINSDRISKTRRIVSRSGNYSLIAKGSRTMEPTQIEIYMTKLERAARAVRRKELLHALGGLSKPSKMPCPGYSIPASDCVQGGKLRTRKNSVCGKCYAHAGMYNFPNVKAALSRRAVAWDSNPNWVADISELLSMIKPTHFRWFDSGDLQTIPQLQQIAEVARRTPGVRHWLPTKEYGKVQSWVKSGNRFPENLTVRLSGYFIDGPTPDVGASKLGCTVSGVSSTGQHTCPAYSQAGKCGSCRMCWDNTCKKVVYKLH